MSRSIYALLIAIDDYPPPVPKLRGCVNDIEAFASYLSERVAKDKGVALKLRTLKNGEATRQAVVDAFSDHLGKAKKGDVALFYYSGHGSQEQAPEEFWKLEPDHLDETLVLFDSRSPGSWDLADKEIAKLIGDVAAKGPHVAVILDCCHSGSGTREIETVVRRVPTDFRRRPIESFLVSVAEAEAASAAEASRRKARAGTPRRRGGMFCSRPAAMMRRRRNMWAMAIIGGRFRSSSASLSGAQWACQPIATCSPERQPCSPGR